MPEAPYSHVLRPDLPWRKSRLTECGRPATDVAKVITRDEAIAMVKQHGIQRAAFIACMTCLQTANRHPEWDDDPVQALAREFYGTKDPRLSDELTAIGLLVAAHREEFDGFMDGVKETVDLAAARRKRARGGR